MSFQSVIEAVSTDKSGGEGREAVLQVIHSHRDTHPLSQSLGL